MFPVQQRDSNSPVKVACDGTPSQPVLDVMPCEVENARSPMMRVLIEIVEQAVCECRKVEKPVLSLPWHRCIAIECTARIDQLSRFQLRCALITLIAARGGEAAERASPLHIPVGEKALFLLRVELGLPLAIEITSIVEAVEERLGNAVVILRIGVGK